MLRSAGILLYRRRPALEVLVAHLGGPFWSRKDERAWTFPKGLCDEDEDEFAAAQREFAEEIGSPPQAKDYLDLGTIKQSNKHVRLWAAEGELDVHTVVSNTFDTEWPPRSGQIEAFPEIDRAEWVSPEVARVKLVASQVPFLDRLLEALGSRS
jgi:predicted NUDIX family NTP pyrophosphohydrolase